MNIQKQVPLAPYTTFKIGGEAQYFVVVTTIAELIDGVRYAQDNDIPVFILGGGSNILLHDEGFDGLVIKIEIQSIDYIDRGNSIEIVAGAGLDWSTFVKNTVQDGFYGVENLALIPGTVGASVVQNIGAYGVEVSDVVVWVEVLNTRTYQMERFQNKECEFTYRSSRFKREKHLIVTRVSYSLVKDGEVKIDYKDLNEYFSQRTITMPTLQNVHDAIVAIRTEKLPDLHVVGTAGSFFKNPIITKRHYKKLLGQYPDMPAYPVDRKNVKVPLAWIIEHVCKMKGATEGNVGIYDKQALVLVNHSSASSEDVKKFAERIIADVKNKTEIEIEREVEYIFTK